MTDPIELQSIKVYRQVTPDKEINLIGNGHIGKKVKHILPADVLASMNYALNLQEGLGTVDDIDHLGNRRSWLVGELLQKEARIGLLRMERVGCERMSS